MSTRVFTTIRATAVPQIIRTVSIGQIDMQSKMDADACGLQDDCGACQAKRRVHANPSEHVHGACLYLILRPPRNKLSYQTLSADGNALKEISSELDILTLVRKIPSESCSMKFCGVHDACSIGC